MRRFAALGLLVALTACSGGGGGSSGASTAAIAPATSTTPGSTTAAPPPKNRVEILAPANGTSVAVATSVTFVGRALDASGAVTQAPLSWTSSIDGALGTGSPLAVKGLSAGIHRIELEAAGARASVVVVVGGAAPLTGQALIDYLRGIPGAIVGTPMAFPPDFMAMIDANPPDVNGIAGNGGLSAGFSEAGTLTLLRWPDPASLDHLDYMSVPGKPKGTGALPGMGAFAGVSVELAGKRVTSWLRDATWKRRQFYSDEGSPVLVTEYASDALGLKARQECFTHPTEDVLVQRFQVEGAANDARLIFYENLAPCTFKVPFLPLTDVHLDLLNDYAAGYHGTEDAIVHFRPEKADYAALAVMALQTHTPASVTTWLDQADARFGRGVYFAIGADRASSAFHVGFDGRGDAYESASAGGLLNNPIAFVRANGALETRVDLSKGSDAVTFYVAAGATWNGPDGAREKLRKARATPALAHRQAAEQDSGQWLARARLPKPPADARTIAFAKRSLLVARAAQSRTTGAIVASLCGQLPYAADWPRDGAFINRALEVAGFPELVEKHNAFYVKTQRTTGLFAGTWHMNFWSDGTSQGPVPLEIDTTAFAVWTLAAHADAITDPVRRATYLQSVYPTIRRGALWLAGWRDPFTGLHLHANEDDNIVPTQTLHGAGPVLLALRSAIKAGQASGETAAQLAAWQGRADELARAIDKHYWDPRVPAYADPKSGTQFNGGPTKASAWLLWPVALHPYSDPRMASTAKWVFDGLHPVTLKQVKRSAYDAKSLVSLAHVWRGDAAKMQLLRDALKTYTHELPTDGTLHVGEFYEVRPSATGPRWTNLNDVPHVWEHVLMYHAAVELYP